MKRLFLILGCALLSLGAGAIKINHGPYLQNVGQTSATIVWTSDVNSVAWVEVAPDDGTTFYGFERPKFWDTHIGIKHEGTVHSVKLEGLQPGTRYRYRVCSTEVEAHEGAFVRYGRTASTDVFRKDPLVFQTSDLSKEQLSFAVFNDIHANAGLLSELADKTEAGNRDLVFFNGDMISLFDSEETFFRGFMDTAVVKFASEVPLYYVRGNHETRGPKAPDFHQYVCPREENLYFSFREGPVYFVCLDCGEDKADSDIEYCGINDYDTYRSEQARWLSKVVGSEEYASAKYHIVLCHIKPLDTPDAWHGDREIYSKFVSILNGADVDLMICAHLHDFSYDAPTSKVKFPILTNDNKSAVVVTVDGSGIDYKIVK